MVDKKMYYEEDDQIHVEPERDKELTEEYKLLQTKFPDKHNGELPKHRFDLGRNCPNCQGRLVFKGALEASDEILLHCSRCGREFFSNDLDNQLPITDKFYKTIPQTVINKWEAHRKRRHKE